MVKTCDKNGVSTTPKIHIILDHLCDYFDDMDITLKSVTDELTKIMHQFTPKRFITSGYKVKDITNVSYGKTIKRNVNC